MIKDALCYVLHMNILNALFHWNNNVAAPLAWHSSTIYLKFEEEFGVGKMISGPAYIMYYSTN
jgi:hypothetical protein